MCEKKSATWIYSERHANYNYYANWPAARACREGSDLLATVCTDWPFGLLRLCEVNYSLKSAGSKKMSLLCIILWISRITSSETDESNEILVPSPPVWIRFPGSSRTQKSSTSCLSVLESWEIWRQTRLRSWAIGIWSGVVIIVNMCEVYMLPREFSYTCDETLAKKCWGAYWVISCRIRCSLHSSHGYNICRVHARTHPRHLAIFWCFLLLEILDILAWLHSWM